MAKFVIDEDIARSTGKVLAETGHEIIDIRDQGLRGSEDEQIFRFAQSKKAILLTGDVGFGNLTKFPLGRPHGGRRGRDRRRQVCPNRVSCRRYKRGTIICRKRHIGGIAIRFRQKDLAPTRISFDNFTSPKIGQKFAPGEDPYFSDNALFPLIADGYCFFRIIFIKENGKRP